MYIVINKIFHCYKVQLVEFKIDEKVVKYCDSLIHT
jgi:hypothetical protein